jgi:hypothetical protein
MYSIDNMTIYPLPFIEPQLNHMEGDALSAKAEISVENGGNSHF